MYNNVVSSELILNNGIKIKNRFVLAPMTTCQSNDDGSITETEINWLAKNAAGGFGMIISPAAFVSIDGKCFRGQLGVHKDSMLAGLRKLRERLKIFGGLGIIQLSHGGSRVFINRQPGHPDDNNAIRYSASSYDMPQIPNWQKPREYSKIQIQAIINDFAEACERVYISGLSGVEIHGCNGYLFTQFISKMSNLRSDEYGGSLENRARFAREVIRACRERVPNSFIIGFRLSFENMGLETGLDLEENIEIARWLFEDGINYLHISSIDINESTRSYHNENLIAYIRSNLRNQTIIACGGITNGDEAFHAIRLGADLVAVGRGAIIHNDLPQRVRDIRFKPTLTPFKKNELLSRGISEPFITYLETDLSMLNIIASDSII